MLTAMTLSKLIDPAPTLTRGQLTALLERALSKSPSGRYEIHQDLTVDIFGEFNIAPLVKDNKLLVKLGDVTHGIRLQNLLTLEGLPKRMLSGDLDIRTDYITSLVGCPDKVRHLYVHAENLTTLRGVPQLSTLCTIKTASLANTDGLAKVRTHCLSLTAKIDAITELPESLEELRITGCKGLAKAVMIDGLKSISVMTLEEGGRVIYDGALSSIFEQLLKEVQSPRKRYFEAQQRLIEAGYEELA